MKTFKNADEMEFEEALKELEEIVKTLEEGKSTLKESVDLYERGTILRKRCESILEEVQLKINQISLNKNGEVSVVPINIESSNEKLA